MPDYSDFKMYATPNRTTTIRPPLHGVRFNFFNYCYPTHLEDLVKKETWLANFSDGINNFFSTIVKEVLRQNKGYQALEMLHDQIYAGHNSQLIEPVKTQDQFLYLMRGTDAGYKKCRDPILLPHPYEELTSFGNVFFDVHYLHIFKIRGSNVEKPIIVTYRDDLDWDAEFTEKGVILKSKKRLFPTRSTDKAFVVPLPFRLTDKGWEALRKWLKMSLDDEKVKDFFRAFYVEFNKLWLEANMIGNKPEGLNWLYVNLFSPFHISLFMARTLADRQHYIAVSDPKYPRQALAGNHIDLEVRYRAILSNLMTQIAKSNSDVRKKVNERFLEHDYERYSLSFLNNGARLARSIEYLMDSWMILKLEDTTFETVEMEVNGHAWIRLMHGLSDTLRAHDKGAWPYENRRSLHSSGKMHSPIIEWFGWMIDPKMANPNTKARGTSKEKAKRIYSEELKRYFWKNEPYLNKVLQSYECLFDMYVSVRVYESLQTGQKFYAWHKQLSDAADKYAKNLDAFYHIKTTVSDVGKAVGYMKFAKDVLGGKFGSDEVKAMIEGAADLIGSPDREAQRRLFRAQLFLKVSVKVIDGAQAGWNSYNLWKAGDYNAMVGAGMVVASSGLWIGCAVALKAAPAGPVAWVIGALAIGGQLILMLATDSDYELFARFSVYQKKPDSGEPKDYFRNELGDKETYKKWPIFRTRSFKGKGTEKPVKRMEIYQAYLSQLGGLLAVINKMDEKPEYDHTVYDLRIKLKLAANPAGSAIKAHVVFKHKSGKKKINLIVQNAHINKKWSSNPVNVNRRNSDAPEFSYCKCIVKAEKTHWEVTFLGKIIYWNYCTFDDGYIELYPPYCENRVTGGNLLSCPAGFRVRRIEDGWTEAKYPNSYEVG